MRLLSEYYSKYQILLEGRDPGEFRRLSGGAGQD